MAFLSTTRATAAEHVPSTNPTPVAERPALLVDVQAARAGLDPFDVRRAVAEELGVPVYAAPRAGTVGTLSVIAVNADELLMAYQGDDGRRRERSVRLPTAADKRLETVALVAGNLARDETGELIAELRPPQPPPAPEATPEAAPPPVAPHEGVEKSTPTEPAPAPPATENSPEGSETEGSETDELGETPLNLSLFHPIAWHRNSERLRVFAELGLVYSNVGRVEGGAITVFVNRLHHGFDGVQLAGVANLTRGSSRGLSMAGTFAYSDGDVEGALVTGMGSYQRGSLSGASLASTFSLQRGDTRGAQVAGIVNYVEQLWGAEVAGALNLAHDVHGVQLAGAANLDSSLDGVMLAGAANVTTGRASGVQLAAVNFAEESAGLQLGVINIARRARGAQVGVINIAEDVRGASVGLIPIAGNGRQHLVLWTSPGHAVANAGAKFRVGPLYSLLALGYQRMSGEDTVVPGAGLGWHTDLEPVYLELDGFFQSRHFVDDSTRRSQWVALRPQLGVQLRRWLALFGGVAIETDVPDGDRSDESSARFGEEVRWRGFGGIQLF